MKEKISACFDRLQSLQIQPTVSNMEKLLQTLYDLRAVYKELTELEATKDAGNAENGQAADPDGRDGN